MQNAALALMTFLLIAAPLKNGGLPADFLGGPGIFSSILVAIFTVELVRILKKYNIGIRLPEQVPENIRASFNLLVPAAVVIVTVYPLNLYLQSRFGMPLPAAIMAMFKPLVAASDTLPGILLAVFLAQVLGSPASTAPPWSTAS